MMITVLGTWGSFVRHLRPKRSDAPVKLRRRPDLKRSKTGVQTSLLIHARTTGNKGELHKGFLIYGSCKAPAWKHSSLQFRVEGDNHGGVVLMEFILICRICFGCCFSIALVSRPPSFPVFFQELGRKWEFLEAWIPSSGIWALSSDSKPLQGAYETPKLEGHR